MLYPKKSLGQNFLTNQAVIQTMTSALEITAEDIIVEIGPGKGALTRAILEKNPKQLTVIEKDLRMVEHLHQIFESEVSTGKLIILHTDVLKWKPKVVPYKLIGNIPFYITGAIIKHVLDEINHPEIMILLMQKEVADRIVLRDGKNSILGTAAQTYCTPHILKIVKPGSFTPPPKVNSAVISFTGFHNPLRDDKQRESFFVFVKQVFANKRKMLLSNINREGKNTVEDCLEELSLKNTIRAEDITPEKLLQLFFNLQKKQGNPQIFLQAKKKKLQS